MSWPKIPTSGKARVLAELTGSIGKGANMRRFRRTKWSKSTALSRYWVPQGYLAGTGTEMEPTFLSVSAPTRLIAITPDPQGLTNQSVYADDAAKLLMLQGSCPVWTLPPQDSPINGEDQVQSPGATLLYWWFLNKSDAADTVQPVADFNPALPDGTGTAGYLRNIMRRKDVIKWGFVDVPPLGPAFSYWDNTATAAIRYFPGMVRGQRAFIPLPKLGRMGIRLDRRHSLDCYVSPILNPETFTSGYTMDGARDVAALPLFRALFARA